MVAVSGIMLGSGAKGPILMHYNAGQILQYSVISFRFLDTRLNPLLDSEQF